MPDVDCRTLILQRFRAFLADHYGPEGDTAALFREVTHGLWQPAKSVRPRATVIDGGQRRDDSLDATDASRLSLTVHLMLDLEGAFDRAGCLDTWTAFVQSLIRSVTPWQGGDGHIETVNYVSDDPFEMPAGEGRSTMHWLVVFEVTYFEQ